MVKPPRKHHFVQAEHLRQFTDADGLLSVYGKDGSRFRDKPQGIFKKKDLNSFKLEGELDTSFEGIATDIENECWPILRRIVEREEVRSDDIEYIATYLSFSRLRNPNVQLGIVEMHRQSFEQTAKLLDRAGHFEEFGPNPLDPEKSLTDLLEEGTLTVDINNSVYLDAIGTMMKPTYETLSNAYHWCLIKSQRGRVAIGDHPLTYVHPGRDPGAYGMTPGGTDCEMAFPLSSNLYLFGKWETRIENFVSEDAVDELNKRQAIFATRHLAHRQDHRRWHSLVRRYRDFAFQTRADTLDFGEGAYQIMRSGVFLNLDANRTKLANPLAKTFPIALP